MDLTALREQQPQAHLGLLCLVCRSAQDAAAALGAGLCWGFWPELSASLIHMLTFLFPVSLPHGVTGLFKFVPAVFTLRMMYASRRCLISCEHIQILKKVYLNLQTHVSGEDRRDEFVWKKTEQFLS